MAKELRFKKLIVNPKVNAKPLRGGIFSFKTAIFILDNNIFVS